METTENIRITAIHSAEVQADNGADTARTHHVDARLTIGADGVTSVNGEVHSEGTAAASFSHYAGGGKNISFHTDADPAEEAAVLAAVNRFIAQTAAIKPAQAVAAIAAES